MNNFVDIGFKNGNYWLEYSLSDGRYYWLGMTEDLLYWWEKMVGVDKPVSSAATFRKYLPQIMDLKVQIYTHFGKFPEEEELLVGSLANGRRGFDLYMDALHSELKEAEEREKEIGFKL